MPKPSKKSEDKPVVKRPRKPAEMIEGPAAYDNFVSVLRQVLTVPKEEINRR